MKYALLIDAGFAKTKLGTRENPASSEDIVGLVEKIKSTEFLANKYLHRVYFYDAPPYSKSHNKPLGGGRHNFGSDSLTVHNKKLLSELKKTDHFSLRLGETRFRGWEINSKSIPGGCDKYEISTDDLRPSIQQKGVDMRIGLDIASLSLKKQVEIIVLVTGDADFVPPMKFARREGVQLALVALSHDVHNDLFEHADISLDIGI